MYLRIPNGRVEKKWGRSELLLGKMSERKWTRFRVALQQVNSHAGRFGGRAAVGSPLRCLPLSLTLLAPICTRMCGRNMYCVLNDKLKLVKCSKYTFWVPRKDLGFPLENYRV
jgi:hypothetical protein